MKTSRIVFLSFAVPLGIFGLLSNPNFAKPVLILLSLFAAVISVEYVVFIFQHDGMTPREYRERHNKNKVNKIDKQALNDQMIQKRFNDFLNHPNFNDIPDKVYQTLCLLDGYTSLEEMKRLNTRKYNELGAEKRRELKEMLRALKS